MAFFFALFNGHFAGRAADANVYPVTFLMLQAVEGQVPLLLFILATFYAGELVWRERDTHFSGIHDALPMRESTDWLAKVLALCFVEFVLVTVMGLCGVIMQTVDGYFQYDFVQYGKELYLIVFAGVITYVLLAFFIQTFVSNKFLGHGILAAIFVGSPILFRFGLENSLLNPFTTTNYTYSDMNGYGHFVQALIWSTTYWLAIAGFLAALSIAFSRRGAESTWTARFVQAKCRLPGLIPALAVCTVVAIGSGAWFYCNAHVLNEFLTTKQQRDIQAR